MDAANIGVRYPDHCPLFFHTYFNGSELPLALQNALRRGSAYWGRPSYLNYIILREITKIEDSEVEANGSFGIITQAIHSEYPTLWVDHSNSTVSIEKNVWEFDDFINLDLAREMPKWW